MVAVIKEARFKKKGDKTGSPFKYRFADKWKIARPKAREDLFMLYDTEGMFVCTVTMKLLREARKEYRNAIADKQDKSKPAHEKGLRRHQLSLF